jgi:hypothetical protein
VEISENEIKIKLFLTPICNSRLIWELMITDGNVETKKGRVLMTLPLSFNAPNDPDGQSFFFLGTLNHLKFDACDKFRMGGPPEKSSFHKSALKIYHSPGTRSSCV